MLIYILFTITLVILLLVLIKQFQIGSEITKKTEEVKKQSDALYEQNKKLLDKLNQKK
jgi:uncharacterized membrane protein